APSDPFSAYSRSNWIGSIMVSAGIKPPIDGIRHERRSPAHHAISRGCESRARAAADHAFDARSAFAEVVVEHDTITRASGVQMRERLVHFGHREMLCDRKDLVALTELDHARGEGGTAHRRTGDRMHA